MSSSDCDLYELSSENSYEREILDESQKLSKAPNSFNFETRTILKKSIIQNQEEKVNLASSILNLSPDHSLSLLLIFNWNFDHLIDSYTQNKTDEFLCKCDLDHYFLKEKSLQATKENFQCGVCCDYKKVTFKLACGHEYCFECHSEYLTRQINNTNNIIIKCMGECKNIYKASEIKYLLYNKFEVKILYSFINITKRYSICKGLDCENVIEAVIKNPTSYSIYSALCKDGHLFCFKCNNGEHSPCPCNIVSKWKKKCSDDSETSNWLSANTKECPKCNSTIEKNGGCNHMTCKQCAEEFCWICMGPWKEHGQSYYTCNKYDESTDKKVSKNRSEHRAALERYLHYYNRFNNHQQSVKLDQKLHLTTEKRMEYIQKNSNFTWIDVQFFQIALDVLIECRNALKWTYAFAYYLKRNNVAKIFEDNQSDLEFAVETLSGYLESLSFEEKEFGIYKNNVINQTKYVSSRRHKLIEDICKGFDSNKWLFESNIK